MSLRLRTNAVALNLPDSAPKLILFGRLVVQKMSNNTWFPSPDLPLDQLTQDLDGLEVAETTARNGGKGTVAARNLAQQTVCEDLVILKGYVRKICNQNPGQADLIIESSGMTRKQYTKPDKAELAARLGRLPETIRLDAKARRGSLYEWQWSSNGGQTWLALDITDVANATLSSVTAETTYSFRFRTKRKGVVSEWSQTVTLTVH